ncbi:MAG: hypothetical protein EBX52_03865 [Proteobacteria bacterium]|nr:hypothetical protein [Pseudomonadota bacterium]
MLKYRSVRNHAFISSRFVAGISLLALLLTASSVFAQTPSPTPHPTGNLLSSTQSSLLTQAISRVQFFDGSTAYYTRTNLQQDLTWGESYVLISYLNIFQATLDPYYLDLFVKHADAVIQARDDRAGRTPSFPAWADSVPALQGNTYWLAVDSGMIIFPIARFAALAKNYNLNTRIPKTVMNRYPSLARYLSITEIANRYASYSREGILWMARREYREAASIRIGRWWDTIFSYVNSGSFNQNTLNLFNSVTLSSPAGTTLTANGFSSIRGYLQPREESAPFFFSSNSKAHGEVGELPYNMENSIGIAAAYLYQYYEQPELLKIAKGLTRNYSDALVTITLFPNAFNVDYWGVGPRMLGLGTPEDISHGWIAGALFLTTMHESGVGMPASVVGRFGRIALDILPGPGGEIYSNLAQQLPDPPKPSDPPDTERFRVYPWWTNLNPYTPGITGVATTVFTNRVPQAAQTYGDAVTLVGVSELLRNSGNRVYGATCQSDSQCSSGICYGLGPNTVQGVCGTRLGNNSNCTRHLDCASGICGSNGLCLASGRAFGQTCSLHSDCASGRCFSGSCQAPYAWSSIGGACLSDLDCPSNGVCGNGTCRIRNALGNGSTCTRNEECASGDCFSNQVCQARLGLGSTCRVDNDCASNICFKNMVCAAPLGTGSTCYKNQECVSNRCVDAPTPTSYNRKAGVCS